MDSITPGGRWRAERNPGRERARLASPHLQGPRTAATVPRHCANSQPRSEGARRNDAEAARGHAVPLVAGAVAHADEPASEGR